MAVSAAFLELVADRLAPLGRIATRRKFGAVSLYVDGQVFALE